jgi:hypothetical protein
MGRGFANISFPTFWVFRLEGAKFGGREWIGSITETFFRVKINEDTAVVCRKGVMEGFIANGSDCLADILGDKDVIDPSIAMKIRAGFGLSCKFLLPNVKEIAL